MVKIELVPDLEHCIETIARKKYTEFAQILLGNGTSDMEIKEKLETLRLFLETADLKKMRAESEKHLVEGEIVRFIIYSDGGVPNYEMQLT